MDIILKIGSGSGAKELIESLKYSKELWIMLINSTGCLKRFKIS